HYVYETEAENEHRQKTSDDLASKLIEFGLLNDETNIDLFGHSYGGRRSLQFAMDYPQNVQSITTIGTPYDKNLTGRAANSIAKLYSRLDRVGFNPNENSNYLDFNPKNSRTDKKMKHSNVYTDMSSVAMVDNIEQLKVANPEAYRRLEEIDMTAAAGRDYTLQVGGILGPRKRYHTHDGAVSVKSQHAESL